MTTPITALRAGDRFTIHGDTVYTLVSPAPTGRAWPSVRHEYMEPGDWFKMSRTARVTLETDPEFKALQAKAARQTQKRLERMIARGARMVLGA